MATAASKKKIVSKQLVKSKKLTKSVKSPVKAKMPVKKTVAKNITTKTKAVTKPVVTKTVKATQSKVKAKSMPVKGKVASKAKPVAKKVVKPVAKKAVSKPMAKTLAKKTIIQKPVAKAAKIVAKPAITAKTVTKVSKAAAVQPANNNQLPAIAVAAPKKVKAPARNKKQKALDKKLARTLVKIANAGRTGLASTGVQSAADAALRATMAMAANTNNAQTAAPVVAVAPAQPAKLEFSTGEMVVYPAHGVGRVEGVETHTIAGTDVKLFKITFEHDKMTLKVPVQRATGSGLRRLSSKDVMKNAMETLRGRPRIRRVMWSRRAQEYEQKINSGDPVAIAEVLRDLRRNAESGEQSYSERQIFQNALDRLAREVAAVEKIEHEKAVKKLEDVLTKTAA